MNNNDPMASVMPTLSYRSTLSQLLTRHMMPGLMPVDTPACAQVASKATSTVSSKATFNAPQPAPTYAYPAQIALSAREDIERLPATAGVYILRGTGDMPLYVGRSHNLRSRVLAHLQDQDAQLLAGQTCRIEYRRAAGELGMSLMESSLRRQLQPLHNTKPHGKRCLHTLRLDAAGQVAVAKVAARDFSRAENLFGIFASQRAAREALHKLVEQHALCAVCCGLEPAAGPGMACFGRQIRRCRGACTGEEAHEVHQARLLRALEELRILPWPYQGAMGIVERADDGWTQVHVMDHWRYLGSVDAVHRDLPSGPAALPAGGFDLDSYKAVIQPYLLGQLELRALPGLHG